jgi:hypothetical protein
MNVARKDANLSRLSGFRGAFRPEQWRRADVDRTILPPSRQFSNGGFAMSARSLTTKAAALLVSGAFVLAAVAPAAAADVKVGVLTCKVAPGIGMIIGSSKGLACDFQPSAGKHERYHGSIDKVGLDIGFTAGEVIIWSVFAPKTSYSHHALAGNYIGGSAEASVGVGLGANVLVGGSERSFALQPVSVQGSTGVNVAAGITSLSLSAG